MRSLSSVNIRSSPTALACLSIVTRLRCRRTNAPVNRLPRQDSPKGLPFRLIDYLELVDWTGRILREDKTGAIDADLPPILERLSIDPKHWLFLTQHFENRFKGLVGTAYKLKQVCEKLGYQRTPGLKNCQMYFP